MTSFLDQLRRAPIQLGPEYHSIDDYYNAQFPEPIISRSATDPWSEEERKFQPVARPELCHPLKRFAITDDFLKANGYKSIDAYFKAEFSESAEPQQQQGPPDEYANLVDWENGLGPPPLAEPVDLVNGGNELGPPLPYPHLAPVVDFGELSAPLAFLFSPETKLQNPEDDDAARATAAEAAWEEYFAEPHNTFEFLRSFSSSKKLAVVRPPAPRSPHASNRRLTDHAEAYSFILQGKHKPTLFGFNAEERSRKAVKFFRACQRELSAKALDAFALWLSESWGTERFHRAGHSLSKGPRCVIHEFGRVWSIQGDSNDYLVMFQAFEENSAFFPLAYFPSGNFTLFVDFLVSLKAVWWGCRVYPKERQQQQGV